MAISDKLLEINQVKEDLKQAIIDKGVDMTGVPFTEYADKVTEISGGGGGDSSQQLYDIDVTLVAPSQNLGGMDVDLYTGSADLTNLYNDCVSNDYEVGRVFIINDVAVRYYGDISGDVGFPIPIFSFGSFDERTLSAESFLVADLTPTGMGLGISLAKVAGIAVMNNKIDIKKGFEYDTSSPVVLPENLKYVSDFGFDGWTSNNQPLVIPNSITSIGYSAFRDWNANTQPLVIPNSVTSIGDYAFDSWTSNNQPLIIPSSITSIGAGAFDSWTSNNQPLIIPSSITSIGTRAFRDWSSNNHPLTIPNNVTSIGTSAFYGWSSNTHPLIIPSSITSIDNTAFYDWTNVPYIEMKSSTPPTLANANAFANQNDAPIYVPDASVDDYKTATIWVSLASRIFSINDK